MTNHFHLTPYPLSACERDLPSRWLGGEGDEGLRGMGALRAPIPLKNPPLPQALGSVAASRLGARGRVGVGVKQQSQPEGSGMADTPIPWRYA